MPHLKSLTFWAPKRSIFEAILETPRESILCTLEFSKISKIASKIAENRKIRCYKLPKVPNLKKLAFWASKQSIFEALFETPRESILSKMEFSKNPNIKIATTDSTQWSQWQYRDHNAQRNTRETNPIKICNRLERDLRRANRNFANFAIAWKERPLPQSEIKLTL